MSKIKRDQFEEQLRSLQNDISHLSQKLSISNKSEGNKEIF
jgi:hypothetical protein